MCTGQKPHISLMTSILPDCIEKETGRLWTCLRLAQHLTLCLAPAGLIRVLPTMQVDSRPAAASSASAALEDKLSSLSVSEPSGASPEWAHIFACGDCANVKEIKVRPQLTRGGARRLSPRR